MSKPPDSAGRPWRRRLIRAAVATTVLAGLATYAVIHYESGTPRPPHCTVADRDGVRDGGEDGGPYRLKPAQAANAATIVAVGSVRELPERATVIAVATAMQESSLFNIDYGDRDSLGLFQQRPSMGWGTEAEIMDPVYSSGEFYDILVQVPDYLELPLTVAAQEVQRSAFPDEYAKHEPEATLLAAALTGREAAAISCTPGSSELIPGEPDLVAEELAYDFVGTVEPRVDGTSVRVAVPEGADAPRGWEVSHWAVTHALELGISRIEFDGRVWSAERAGDGWTETGDEDADGAASGEVLLTVSE
ncbi:hypothetical protein [Streptomyces otsuchiensis]|uniref:hypothetical protein n=1 Tax=Streptomyces otsuchiensis TaxID=2681388 RepID=UPI0010302DBF|nr:hypothetical protein [Streptomyces otsuchiensis]